MAKVKGKTGQKTAQALKNQARKKKNSRITNYPGIGRPPGDAGVGVSPEPPSQGGGGGGGGGGVEPPPTYEIDIPGLPPEIAAQVHAILISGRADADKEAIRYVMTTPWFKQEYAGYDQGYANGLFADPFSGGLARYQQYKQNVSGYYRQYYGRDVTVSELTGLISNRYDENHVQQQGQGHVLVQTNQADWNYLSGAFGSGQLTEAEKTAYGEELAGIDTPLGAAIKAKVDSALQRMQGVFQGKVGSSALGDQSLVAGLQKKPDIQA